MCFCPRTVMCFGAEELSDAFLRRQGCDRPRRP